MKGCIFSSRREIHVVEVLLLKEYDHSAEQLLLSDTFFVEESQERQKSLLLVSMKIKKTLDSWQVIANVPLVLPVIDSQTQTLLFLWHCLTFYSSGIATFATLDIFFMMVQEAAAIERSSPFCPDSKLQFLNTDETIGSQSRLTCVLFGEFRCQTLRSELCSQNCNPDVLVLKSHFVTCP